MDKYPGCGLLSANVTRDTRIGYREWLLPFTGSPSRGNEWVPTSSDPRMHLLPVDVLRIDNERPLDQDMSALVASAGLSAAALRAGHMTEAGLRLRKGYPGVSGRELPVWGTNLERLPGLCDVVKGSARIRTSEDTRTVLSEGDTVVLPQQLDGRVVVAGKIGADGFDADSALTRSTRIGLPCYRVVPGKGPRTVVVPTDLSGVIEGIRGEANAAFGGDIEAALLPGMLTMTRDAKHVTSSVDLRPYLSPLSVLRVGPTYPEIVAPQPGISTTAFDVLARWRLDSADYQGFITPYRVLPGLSAPQRGKHCFQATVDVTAILAPGDMIMIDRTPRLIVAFKRPPAGTPGELLTGEGPTVTKSAVCLTHPWAAPPGSDKEEEEEGALDAAPMRGWYFHDNARLIDPAVLRAVPKPGSVDVLAAGGSSKQSSKPDPRPLLEASQDVRLLCMPSYDGKQQDRDVAGFPRPVTLWGTSIRMFLAPRDDGTVVTRHGFELSEPWPESAASTMSQEEPCLVLDMGRRLLPGTAAVTKDSAVYSTTADLREAVVSGAVIQAGIFRKTAVAGVDLSYGEGSESGAGAGGGSSLGTGVSGEVNLPVTESALQTTFPHLGKSESGLALTLYPYRQLPCNVSVVHNSPVVTTLCDMSDVLMGVDMVRVLVYRRLPLADSVEVSVISPTSFTLASPYPGTSKKNVPVYAYPPGEGGAPHTHDLAYARLPGCAHVINGSPYVTTTDDLTTFLDVGDALRIGTRQLLVVAQPPSPRSIRLTIPWPGRSDTCIVISRMFRRLELTGKLDCKHGDPTCTTSKDVRRDVAVGEVLVIVSKTDDGKAQAQEVATRVSEATGTPLLPNEREFSVVTPFTDELVTLSEAYSGPTERNLIAFRVIFGAGMGVLLPGYATVTNGSPYVKTSEDVSGSIRAGEMLRIGLREFTAAEPITPSGFTLTVKYGGTSATGLKVFNLGRTERQISLEALAALKLRCRSIFCLAKIEQLERETPSDLTRALTAGRSSRAVLAALQSDQSAVPYIPTPEEYARGEYTADAAAKKILGAEEEDREDVEREWSRWFSTQRGDDVTRTGGEILGGNEQPGLPSEQMAIDGAQSRVTERYNSL